MDLRIIHGAISAVVGAVAILLLYGAGSAGAAVNGILWGCAAYTAAEAVIVARGYRAPREDATPAPEKESVAGDPEDSPPPIEADLALPKKWMSFKETVAEAAKGIDTDKQIDVQSSATAMLGIVKEYEELIGLYGDILPIEEQDGMLALIKQYTARISESIGGTKEDS